MLYNLPNGRVIYISIEMYLSMTDDELNQMAYLEYGEEISSTTSLSNIFKESKGYNTDDIIDYEQDNDDTDTCGPFDLKNLPEDL